MTIGSLIVKIGADISGIRRDAAKGAEALGGLERGAKSLGTALKVLAFGAVAKEITSMVRGAMDAIDTSAKLARQLGGTINGLQGLRLAASEAGVSTTGLTTASEMLNRRLGEAARKGSGDAYEALKRLSLCAEELSAMDTDERIAALADAFEREGYNAQQTADTLARLGIRQAEFTRIVMDGGAPIRAARQAIDDLGLSLSEVDAAKVEAANDAIQRVKLASTAVTQQVAVSLAPVLTAISNLLLDAAKDADGLKDAVASAVELGIKGFGYLGDAVRGVHLVFKTVELALWGLGTALTEVFRGGLKAISFFVDGGIGQLNELIEIANQLPGIDITPVALTGDSPFLKALDEFAAGMRETTAAVFQQLQDLATEEWPSDKAEKFFAAVQTAAQNAAQEVIRSRREMLSLASGAGDGSTEAEQKELDRYREHLSARLDILREHSMTEEELQRARHEKNLDELNKALDAQLVSSSDFARISEGLERQHMEALARVRKKGMDRVQDVSVSSMLSGVKQITSQLVSLTATAAKENRAMFDVHKAFAIADAVISGAQGVAQTMGSYPYPYYIPMAVAHAAAAAAQVATISSQQFQGGRKSVAAPAVTAGGSGGGRSVSAQAPAVGGGVTGGLSQLVNINLEGEVFSRATMLSLIDALNDAVADGARIVVA